MINFNKTALSNFCELYYEIKVKNKDFLFKRIKEIIDLKMNEIKRNSNSSLEEVRMLSRYFNFEIKLGGLSIKTISVLFFKECFNLEHINENWYKPEIHEIKDDDKLIYNAAALYKAGIALPSYKELKSSIYFVYRGIILRYLEEERKKRKSMTHTKFSIYFEKIEEKEIVEVLTELKRRINKEKHSNIEKDILFEYLKRT